MIVLFMGIFSGCYYDVAEEIYPSTECDTVDVTYSGTVLPLLQERCFTCHSAAANMGSITLEGFNNLKTLIDNGRFLGAIRHEPGFTPMPQNAGMLPDCQIMKIEAWINSGAENN